MLTHKGNCCKNNKNERSRIKHTHTLMLIMAKGTKGNLKMQGKTWEMKNKWTNCQQYPFTSSSLFANLCTINNYYDLTWCMCMMRVHTFKQKGKTNTHTHKAHNCTFSPLMHTSSAPKCMHHFTRRTRKNPRGLSGFLFVLLHRYTLNSPDDWRHTSFILLQIICNLRLFK